LPERSRVTFGDQIKIVKSAVGERGARGRVHIRRSQATLCQNNRRAKHHHNRGGQSAQQHSTPPGKERFPTHEVAFRAILSEHFFRSPSRLYAPDVPPSATGCTSKPMLESKFALQESKVNTFYRVEKFIGRFEDRIGDWERC